jgi:hypothetical protein
MSMCLKLNLLQQANVTKILAKAYMQLERFSKSNESKTVSIYYTGCLKKNAMEIQQAVVHHNRS